MDKTIEIAKCTLANIFGIKKEEFDRSITRKSNVVEARRYLIYFLVNELNLKFVQVPGKMNCISTHASAIHHFYKMIYLMENENETKLNYMKFKNQIISKGLSSLEKELDKQIGMRKVINWNIKQLKEMINES